RGRSRTGWGTRARRGRRSRNALYGRPVAVQVACLCGSARLEMGAFPLTPLVTEVALAHLLVLLDRPQQAVLVDAGFVANRVDRCLAVARAATVHHREDAVGPVVVRRPAVAVTHG